MISANSSEKKIEQAKNVTSIVNQARVSPQSPDLKGLRVAVT